MPIVRLAQAAVACNLLARFGGLQQCVATLHFSTRAQAQAQALRLVKMAAAVNNIAATFSGTRSGTAMAPASSSAAAHTSGCIIATWNPHTRQGFSKTSFVGLHGGAGPQKLSIPRKNVSATRRSVSRSFNTVKAVISVGDKLPEAELAYLDKEGSVTSVKVSELTEGKKAVFFAVPGAFTPTCSQKHLPGFIEKADELRAAGVDTIACIAVNDVFVLRAWGESVGAGDKVLVLSDGLANFTKALGVTVDLSDKPVGLGVRSRRYALLAENGVVKTLNLEEGGAFTISSAEEILKALKAVV